MATHEKRDPACGDRTFSTCRAFPNVRRTDRLQPKIKNIPRSRVPCFMSVGQFFYPAKMGRIILLGMEEVMGLNGMNSVLRLGGLEGWIQNYPSTRTDKT